MPLIRGHHSFDDHFTQIPNDWVRDTRLSLKAIGLLVQLMSHSPGWNMSIRSLAKANGTGIDTIKSAVLELEKNGYLVRSEKQKQNPDGTFADYEWTTADPFQNPVTDKPRHGQMEHKEEQFIKEEQVIKNREIEIPNYFDDFWKIYPRKEDKALAKKRYLKALKIVDHDTLLSAVTSYAQDPNLPLETRYIKKAHTWLEAESWNNGPLPERRKNNTKENTDWEAVERWAREQDELEGRS